MKNCLKYFLFVGIYVVLGNAGFAQLPSERPMSAIAPKLLKDGPPREQPSAGELPSNKKNMDEVKAPKGKTIPKRRTNAQADPNKLPSNSKTRIKDLVKKPKVKK